MKEITKQVANDFYKDFHRVNKLLGMTYGVAIKLESLSYTSSSLKGSFVAYSVDKEEDACMDADSFEKLEFEKLAPKFGFTKDDYKCEVESNYNKGLLVGFLPKARKYKYIILINGIKYKVDSVKKI